MRAGETEVNVRYNAGTYVARGGGKSCSSTAGGDNAVVGLVQKLGWYGGYSVRGEQQLEANHTRLWIKREGR